MILLLHGTTTSLFKDHPSLLLQPASSIQTLSLSYFSDMAKSLPLVSTIFVLLLLLVATEMGPMVAEARTCESQSHRFRGTCLSKSNCANVCRTEGFPGGHCRGFRRRCFCTRPC